MALFSQPHRAFFLLGTVGLVGFMSWWAAQLSFGRETVLPAGWLHGLFMIHGVFAPFVFGFLFTAMPHWTAATAPRPSIWRVAWSLLASGLLIAFVGSFVGIGLALTGWLLVLGGWAIGMYVAMALWLNGQSRALHTPPVILALFLGTVSAAAVCAWLGHGDWRWSFLAMRVGFWGFLFVIYVAVCHRMIPFFASRVLDDYQPYRPAWTLYVLVAAAVAHLTLELRHAYHLLWLAHLPMLLVAVRLAARWQCWRLEGNRLLGTLFIAWLVLCGGLALTVTQDLTLALTGRFVLGRAPQHLIAIGFFGGMLVAMATRVTLGHSGRPLVMGRPAWWCFLGFQLAAVSRVASEIGVLQPAGHMLLIASALLWIAASTAWAASHAHIYWRS